MEVVYCRSRFPHNYYIENPHQFPEFNWTFVRMYKIHLEVSILGHNRYLVTAGPVLRR